jgi:hypothetical protein
MDKIPGNLSSVHHASFERLHDITNNYNQATLLDKLIFWWQISNYTLEDGHTWFTRSITQIATEARLSERSVGRYLKIFSDAGYIEKTTRLYKKKNLYIRVTDKLLLLVGSQAKPTGNKEGENTLSLIKKQDGTDASCIFSEHVGMTGSANLAVSIYKEKDCNTSSNTTVSEPCSVTFWDNSLKNKNIQTNNPMETTTTTQSPNYPTYAVEQQIGERLPETTKNYIKGTMKNLNTQHQLVFSNPEQVFSEIVFSLMNVEQQFPGVLDTHHRINLIAKLMREKKWRTPKGFYNHWDVGQTYKAQQEKQRVRERCLKHKEGRGNTLYPSPEVNVSNYTRKTVFNAQTQAYQELQGLIATETRYLKTMEARFERKPDPMTEHVIENIAMKLAGLHKRIGELKGAIQQEAA